MCWHSLLPNKRYQSPLFVFFTQIMHFVCLISPRLLLLGPNSTTKRFFIPSTRKALFAAFYTFNITRFSYECCIWEATANNVANFWKYLIRKHLSVKGFHHACLLPNQAEQRIYISNTSFKTFGRKVPNCTPGVASFQHHACLCWSRLKIVDFYRIIWIFSWGICQPFCLAKWIIRFGML